MNHIARQISDDGYAVVHDVLSQAQLEALIGDIPSGADGTRGGLRNLLDLPEIQFLSRQIRHLVVPIIGPEAIAVRGLLFDKTPSANWKVTWHQDTTIAVKEVCEADGFGAWTTKAGVVHVRPPASILESMISVRLHVDDCGVANGPLRVLPGSHRNGVLLPGEITRWRSHGQVRVCAVSAGSAVLMRPLLLHASSAATTPGHRRVIHIEYAIGELPGGLKWMWADASASGAI